MQRAPDSPTSVRRGNRSGEAPSASCFRSFVIYNPTLSQGKEERAMDNILFFYPPGVSPNKQMNHVGLCTAVMCLVERFQPTLFADEIRSDERCITVFSPQPNLYMALEADELYDAAICTPLLRKAFFCFCLRHGLACLLDPRGRGEGWISLFFTDFCKFLDRYVMNANFSSSGGPASSYGAGGGGGIVPTSMSEPPSPRLPSSGGININGSSGTVPSSPGVGLGSWTREALSESLLHSPLRLQGTTTFHYTSCASIVSQYLSLITVNCPPSNASFVDRWAGEGGSVGEEDEAEALSRKGCSHEDIDHAAAASASSSSTMKQRQVSLERVGGGSPDDGDGDGTVGRSNEPVLVREGSLVVGSGVPSSPPHSTSRRQVQIPTTPAAASRSLSSAASPTQDVTAGASSTSTLSRSRALSLALRPSTRIQRSLWSTTRCLVLRRDDRRLIFSSCGDFLSVHLTFLSMIDPALTSFMIWHSDDAPTMWTGSTKHWPTAHVVGAPTATLAKYCCLQAVDDVLVFLIVEHELHQHLFTNIETIAVQLAQELSQWMSTGSCGMLRESRATGSAAGVATALGATSVAAAQSASVLVNTHPPSTSAALAALRDGSSWLCWNHNIVHGAMLAHYPRLVQWTLGNLMREAIVSWRTHQARVSRDRGDSNDLFHGILPPLPSSVIAETSSPSSPSPNRRCSVSTKTLKTRPMQSLVEVWLPMGTDGWLFVCQRHGRIVGIPFHDGGSHSGGSLAYLSQCFDLAEATICRLFHHSQMLSVAD